MNGVGPLNLWEAADELLGASVEALNTIPLYDATLVGSPDRAFVAAGFPVLDCCDQLTVNVAQVLTAPVVGGLPAGRQTAAKLNHVYLLVTITRCVPIPDEKGNPPPMAALEASSKQIDADGWALWNHLYNLWIAGHLFTVCDEVFWDALRPLGPAGGCAGYTMAIHISLDGYPEAISS